MSEKPYKIVENKVYGRYIVAVRDIVGGETIIEEVPLVSGPVFDAQDPLGQVCAACCHKFRVPSFPCPNCTLPLCSEGCSRSPIHALQECLVLRNVLQESSTVAPSLLSKGSKELYNFIMLIRALLCWDKEPAEKIKLLQGKVEELEKVGAFPKSLSLLCWHHFPSNAKREEEDIETIAKHALGSMRINSYSTFTASTAREGLYFLSSFLPHSCLPNTDREIEEGTGRMVTRASRLIRTGEPIATTYLSVCSGTGERWKELGESWLFFCSCDRCRSRDGELGSHLSTVRCPSCRKICLSPFVEDEGVLRWSCWEDDCGYSRVGWDEELSNVLENEEKQRDMVMEALAGGDVEGIEEWLDGKSDSGSHHLHPNHSILLQTKLYLCQYYGRNEGVEKLEDQRLGRKAKYCQDVLGFFECLFPSTIDTCKGRVLFELWQTLNEIKGRVENKREMSREGFCEINCGQLRIRKIRADAVAILQYSIGSQEREMLKILEERPDY